MLVLLLGACGDGTVLTPGAPVSPVAPVAPLEPVVPVVPSPPVPAAAANSVFVANPESGEIRSYVGQPRAITLEFRANQGIASNLKLSLPSAPGWRAAGDALNCATVDPAGACRLQAMYTPTAPAASSTMRFSYTYTDNTGAAREGDYSLAYRVLPVNTVVTRQQPEGMVRSIVGRISPVTLEFETSDGEPATSLKVSTDLAALPAGWKSGRTEFACAEVGGGQLCRLALIYSPALPAGDSVLDLAYNYVDSSGALRSGTARLDYSAVLAGTVSASLDASGPLVVKPGGEKEVTVRFAASDGAQASALRMRTDPANTPGWSVKPGWQGCATVEGNDSCSLTLVFAPTAVHEPGTLSLTYAYVNNIGEGRTGSVDIAYSSRVYEAYIADYREDTPGGVRLCTIDTDGALANCAAAGVALPAQGRRISHVLASGRQAYVSSLAASNSSSVFLCAIAADGALINCTATGGIRTGVRRVLLRGAWAYILTDDGRILRQDLDVASGAIAACPAARGDCQLGGVDKPVTSFGFAGTKGYIVRPGVVPNDVEATQCNIATGGDFDCTGTAFLSNYVFTAGALATFEDGDVARIYIAGEPYYPSLNGDYAVIRCDAPAGRAVSGCNVGKVAKIDYQYGYEARLFHDLAFDGGHAYIVHEARIFLCDISDGDLLNCKALDGTGATSHFSLSINRIN